MRANRIRWFLVFLLVGAAFQLPAQQSEADRKLLATVRAKAEKEDAESQYELGNAFSDGSLGVAKDYAEAVNWWRKAAEHNNVKAQVNLGFSYATGTGVAKDEVEAMKWYRKAAEQNDPKAQSKLGYCYFYGAGVAKDKAEGVKWYRKAAEQNHAAAQDLLGYYYADGQGVAKDEVEAVKWWVKAAEQNDADAQNNLGACYANGQGVAKDEVEAVRWLRKAAEQNYANAQYNLGYCYANSRGVVKDYVEAYKWILLAAGQGNEIAKEATPGLEAVMTREQIAEGQKQARNFKPRELPTAGAERSAASIAQTRPESSGTGFFITEDGYLIPMNMWPVAGRRCGWSLRLESSPPRS